jgi:hypothetical protein
MAGWEFRNAHGQCKEVVNRGDVRGLVGVQTAEATAWRTAAQRERGKPAKVLKVLKVLNFSGTGKSNTFNR